MCKKALEKLNERQKKTLDGYRTDLLQMRKIEADTLQYKGKINGYLTALVDCEVLTLREMMVLQILYTN